MKSKLILTAIAVCLSLSGFAQTKGTNVIGFGLNVSENTTTSNNGEVVKTKQNSFSLGYGHFITDNTKIGLDLSYMISNQKDYVSNQSEISGYGGNLDYQKYYPIVKKLFAYAGGTGGYFHSKQTSTLYTDEVTYLGNNYSLGAYGGVTWFPSKRFALETKLLSANMNYSTARATNNSSGFFTSNKDTSFNLKTEGFINNLGFKIYLLF